MKQKMIILLSSVLLCLPLLGQNEDRQNANRTDPGIKAAEAVLRKLDANLRFPNRDLTALYTIVSEKPGEPGEVREARIFRRDREDKFLIIILKPSAEKGNGYLRLNKDIVWFYDRSGRTFERTTLRESVSGSNAQNRDFQDPGYSENYRVVSRKKGKLGKFPVLILDLAARTKNASYSFLKIWVSQENTLLLKEAAYSSGKRLMRTLLIPRYTRLGQGTYLPQNMLILDHLNPGEKTQISIKNPSLSRLSDGIFKKEYLERVSR